jgi:N-acyl-D-amino-acid deacylase
MQLPTLTLLFWFALLTPLAPAKAQPPVSKPIRPSINRALLLLQKSLMEYPRHETCFSCHHQGVSMFTLSLARARGYTTAEKKSVENVIKHTAADLQSALLLYQKGEGQPGGVTRAGYALFALQSGGVERDAITTAVTGFLLQRDQDKGFWSVSGHRPPSEASAFTDTFLAIRALKTYGQEAQKDAITARIARARQWLEQTPPKDTEDRVFQLWGLYEAGTARTRLQEAVKELLAEQRKDGGWAQLPEAASDAYATGTVLTALCLAGGLSTEDSAYRQGVQFLLQSQQADGSWRVTSRSKPFQPYFESGFPHGKDQFISMAASGWATAALILAGSPAEKTTRK